MNVTFAIARRYLRVRQGETLLSIVVGVCLAGIAVGVAALVIVLALMSGFQRDIRSRILGVTPHLNLINSWAGEGIPDSPALQDRVAALPGVRAVRPVVQEQGLLDSAAAAQGHPAIIRGVGAGSGEAPIGTVVTGRGFEALAEHPDGILLGQELAHRLGVLDGEEVRLITLHERLLPFAPPVPRSKAFTVLGIVETGLHDYDLSHGFTSLAAAQRLSGRPDTITSLEVWCEDLDVVDDLKAQILGFLPEGVRCFDWRDLNAPLFSALRLEKIMMFIALSLITVVAAFNITTMLAITVLQKRRDIGILQSLGAQPAQIQRIFIQVGLLLGGAGTLLGTVLGAGIAWALDHFRMIPLDQEIYLRPYVPFALEGPDLAGTIATALVVCLLSTLVPARRAAQVQPMEVLRYE